MSGQEVTDAALIAQLEAQSSVRGDEFLKTLEPAHAQQVKAMAEGRMPIPSGYVLKTPFGQQLLNDVAQYDQTFDTINVGSRSKTRGAFTSGVQARNITSFNTALGHLQTLASAAEDLHNTGFPIYNRIANGIGGELSPDLAGRLKAFGIAKQAVVEELGRAFKGAAPDVHGTKEWEKQISDADSPEALRRAIGQAADLLGSRINAMQDSYNQGMGTSDQPLPMLSPHARDALSAFQTPDYYTKGLAAIAPSLGAGGGDVPPPSTPSAPTPSGPSGPAPSAPQAPVAPPAMAISDGTTEAATGPEDQRLNSAISAMVAQGKSGNDIRAFITAQGADPSEFSGIDDAVSYARTHKGYRPDVYTNKPMTGARSLAAKIAGSGPGAAVLAAANTGAFQTIPKVAALGDAVLGRLTGDNRDFGTIYDGSLAGANYKMEAAREAHPGWSLAGDVGGFFGGDAVLGALPGMARLARATPAAVRPVLGDALFGAASGAGGSDSLSDIPGNVVKGAALTGVGGAVGRQAVRGAAAVLSPAATGAVRRLTDAGVTLTPGQVLGAGGGLVGRAVKGVEDRLAGFPLVGDVVNSTRRTGVEEFNRKAINDALAPIGQSLPDDVAVGHGGVAHAQQMVSEAFNNALAPLHAQLDNQIVSDLRGVGQRVAGMAEDQRRAFSDIMDADISPYWPQNGVFTGENLQAIKQGLDKEIARRRVATASPSDQRLGDRLEEVRDAVLDLAGRTDPQNAAAYQAANHAFSLLSRVNGAASKAKDGVFTPNQFRQAVTKRGYGTTTASVARGSSRMQELATDASTVLPSTVPDSGTAGREALMLAARLSPGAVLGGAAGYHEGGSSGALTGALAGSALLSRPGARAFQYLAAGSRGNTANTLGAMLRRNSALGGAVGAPLLLPDLSNNGN